MYEVNKSKICKYASLCEILHGRVVDIGDDIVDERFIVKLKIVDGMMYKRICDIVGDRADERVV